MSEVRCQDCLKEFNDGPQFAVIKEDTSREFTLKERLAGGGLYQAIVCEACAGWYDHSFAVKEP
jgi:hypothetical protein